MASTPVVLPRTKPHHHVRTAVFATPALPVAVSAGLSVTTVIMLSLWATLVYAWPKR